MPISPLRFPSIRILALALTAAAAAMSPVHATEPGPGNPTVLNQCELQLSRLPGQTAPARLFAAPRASSVSSPGSTSLALPSATPSWTYETNQTGSRLGWTLGGGDIDGDGIDDLLVAAREFTGGEFHEGAAFVFKGSTAGLPSSPTWTIESNLADARLGGSGGIVKDVNHDGRDDLLLSAYYYSGDQEDEGLVALFSGGPMGPGCGPVWLTEGNEEDAYFGITAVSAGDINGDGYGDVLVAWAVKDENGVYGPGRAVVYKGNMFGLDTSPSWSVTGTQPGEYLAIGASAGDVNGDGYGDVVVAAPKWDGVLPDSGKIFLYLGSAAGLPATPNWTAEANQVSTYFGETLVAGDVNGDGYDDLMVSAKEYDVVQNNDGAVFVYHGSPAGLPATPSLVLHGDGPGFELAGAATSGALMDAGDVNGDGYADLLVGATQLSHPEVHEGTALLYLGSPAGLSSTPAWRVEGNQSASQFGSQVDLTDVNGDGLDDVVVGAYGYSTPESEEGRVFVYLSQAPASESGSVPESDPLTLAALPGGNLQLAWGASCVTGDSDYEIYEGSLGDFASHAPSTCSTGGLTTYQIAPSSGDRYYLVVPRNASREGSYGLRSDGVERPASATACVPQSIATGCR